MIDLNDLGDEIKNARKQRKLTREKLAELSGLSRARIEALENGRVADMGFKRVLTLMNIVGLDFRLTTFNNKRPTLEDIMEEDEAARLVGSKLVGVLMRSGRNELADSQAGTCGKLSAPMWDQSAGSGARIGIDGGMRVGRCVLPSTQASMISDHSCIMCRRCTSYSALL